jgi:hypothetical protein
VDVRGLNGLGQCPRRQHGGQPPRWPRLARPKWTQEEDIRVRTPAGGSVSPPFL